MRNREIVDGRIFYDIDTQKDFMNENGALYVTNAELIKPNLKLLTEANYHDVHMTPRVGSIDRHFGTFEYKEREGELTKYGGPFPNHCMDNTIGFEQIDETRADAGRMFKTIRIPNRLDGKVNKEQLAEAAEQAARGYKSLMGKPTILFEKQSYDIFTNPAFEAFLEVGKVKEAIVYGVATDYCVKAAVTGMQERGVQCYVVKDAIAGVAPDTTKQAIEQMATAGARFVTTKDVLEGRL